MSGEPSIPPPTMLGVGGMKTNLYHNHTKSKNVCFRCGFIASLEKDLWRSPCSSISLYPRYKNRVQVTGD